MSDPNTSSSLAVGALLSVGYGLGALHFESAVGALLGSFFFMSLPSTSLSLKSVFLWIASVAFGYLTGSLVAKLGYDIAAALSAFALAAFGSTILIAIQKYLDGGPLPNFLERILDRVPFLANKRGNTDV